MALPIASVHETIRQCSDPLAAPDNSSQQEQRVICQLNYSSPNLCQLSMTLECHMPHDAAHPCAPPELLYTHRSTMSRLPTSTYRPTAPPWPVGRGLMLRV